MRLFGRSASLVAEEQAEKDQGLIVSEDWVFKFTTIAIGVISTGLSLWVIFSI